MPRLGKIRLTLLAVVLSGIVGSSSRAQSPPPGAVLPSPDPPAPEREGFAASLRPPPPRPPDRPLPINLATALRLSADRPLVVAAAQASAMVAQAQLERSKVLWVPTLNTGFDYYRHDGGIQDLTTGRLAKVGSNFFYAGGGASLIVATTDAIFMPLAARQVLSARQLDIQTARNDALLETATAYFTVHEKRGTYAGTLDTVNRGRDLVSRIEKLGAGLVPEAEADRARALLADLEQQAASARADWRVSSARLTRVLRLDPAAVIVPLEPDHLALSA
jgi:outer membrane protein TolC